MLHKSVLYVLSRRHTKRRPFFWYDTDFLVFLLIFFFFFFLEKSVSYHTSFGTTRPNGQGCPQAIAHSDCAFFSNRLRFLLSGNYCRITAIWVQYVLSTNKTQCLALSTLENFAIYFEISGHPWMDSGPLRIKQPILPWQYCPVNNIGHQHEAPFALFSQCPPFWHLFWEQPSGTGTKNRGVKISVQYKGKLERKILYFDYKLVESILSLCKSHILLLQFLEFGNHSFILISFSVKAK